MIIDLPQPVAIACHDAGAANVIFSWLASEPDLAIRPFVGGPAAEIWKRTFPQWPVFHSLEHALDGAQSVLSGTGWASDLEHRAREEALRRGLPSVAVIDHWVNYPARFERDGQVVLPDAVWVCDATAQELAQRQLDLPTVIKPNIYLQTEAARAGNLPCDGDVLFVMEPVGDDWGGATPGEIQAFEYYFAHRDLLGIGEHIVTRLRPHPSDPPGKYAAWLDSRNFSNVVLDAHATLYDAMTRARWVVGCQSFALVVAAAANRVAVSALPPCAPACPLPLPELVHLREIAP